MRKPRSGGYLLTVYALVYAWAPVRWVQDRLRKQAERKQSASADRKHR